jgi:hypothetical protein
MPLRICPDQQILFVHEATGYSIALHGAGIDVKGLLMNCPVLNELLPRARCLPCRVSGRARSEECARANPLLGRSRGTRSRSRRDDPLYRIRRPCKRHVDSNCRFSGGLQTGRVDSLVRRCSHE